MAFEIPKYPGGQLLKSIIANLVFLARVKVFRKNDVILLKAVIGSPLLSHGLSTSLD